MTPDISTRTQPAPPENESRITLSLRKRRTPAITLLAICAGIGLAPHLRRLSLNDVMRRDWDGSGFADALQQFPLDKIAQHEPLAAMDASFALLRAAQSNCGSIEHGSWKQDDTLVRQSITMMLKYGRMAADQLDGKITAGMPPDYSDDDPRSQDHLLMDLLYWPVAALDRGDPLRLQAVETFASLATRSTSNEMVRQERLEALHELRPLVRPDEPAATPLAAAMILLPNNGSSAGKASELSDLIKMVPGTATEQAIIPLLLPVLSQEAGQAGRDDRQLADSLETARQIAADARDPDMRQRAAKLLASSETRAIPLQAENERNAEAALKESDDNSNAAIDLAALAVQLASRGSAQSRKAESILLEALNREPSESLGIYGGQVKVAARNAGDSKQAQQAQALSASVEAYRKSSPAVRCQAGSRSRDIRVPRTQAQRTHIFVSTGTG